ncbi:MAG: hypothetical protein H0X27_04285 [Caulobacteraceae bacterium]|nr:hypothetical protein [Caulobacteraceae bacterium]
MVDFLASLLRIVGMEDGGWDPYLESRKVLEDLNSLLKIRLPAQRFPDQEAARWRLGLLFYSHIVEIDSVYEVLANLLRYHLGVGYSPNPFYKYLSPKQQAAYAKRGLYPTEKIKIIKKLDQDFGLPIGELFEEFFQTKLRNPVAHSNYILTDKEFRCRKGTGAVGTYKLQLAEVDDAITKAKAFYSAFFGIEHASRTGLAKAYGGRAIPYDLHYKGLMEMLVDGDGLLCGFKVHWPNSSESVYRQGADKCEMTNMMLGKDLKVELFVGLYARTPGDFSPLVERESEPIYTPLADGSVPIWRQGY